MKKIILLFCLYSLNSIYAQIPNYVPANGLIAYYPFDGNANDVSGNGNNGINNGATLTTDRFGNINKAYNFNGSNNSIDCGQFNSISNPIGDLTQSAWVLAPINQSSFCKMSIMSKRQVESDSWPTIGGGANGTSGFPVINQAYFFLNSQNYLAGIQNAMHSINFTNDGNWHLIVGTKNGSIFKLYFDGILQSTTSDNSTLSSNSNLIIGHEAIWGFDCEKWYSGKLDDIGIWNRALTQEEITNLFTADNTCQSLVINTSLLSFNPPTYNNTVTIYPNPANDHITIDCGTLANVSGWNIKITNILGQEVFNQPMNTQQYVVPLNTWTGQGVYFVKIYDAQGTLVNTKKIILQ